jgi:hypothetical protein
LCCGLATFFVASLEVSLVNPSICAIFHPLDYGKGLVAGTDIFTVGVLVKNAGPKSSSTTLGSHCFIDIREVRAPAFFHVA